MISLPDTLPPLGFPLQYLFLFLLTPFFAFIPFSPFSALEGPRMTGCAASSTPRRGGSNKWEVAVGARAPRVCLHVAPAAGQFTVPDGNLSIQSGLPSPICTEGKGKRVSPDED